MVLISLLKWQDPLKIWLHPRTAYWKMPLKLQPCQVTFCRLRSWGSSNCLFARPAWCLSLTHWQTLWELQPGMGVCPALSQPPCLPGGGWSTQPGPCVLGSTWEEPGLELAWIMAASIRRVARADDAGWTDSSDHLQRSLRHRNTPVCAIAAVGLLSLGAATDRPEQVVCVSGTLAWSKTGFRKHSWQCKKRNSFSVCSFDCFGVCVCWEQEALYSGWVYIPAWCYIWDEPQQRL